MYNFTKKEILSNYHYAMADGNWDEAEWYVKQLCRICSGAMMTFDTGQKLCPNCVDVFSL